MIFKEEKETGLMGITHVQTETDKDGFMLEHPFKILADASGIRFRGDSRPITGVADLDSFARALDKAYRMHRSYMPKITNAAGH